MGIPSTDSIRNRDDEKIILECTGRDPNFEYSSFQCSFFHCTVFSVTIKAYIQRSSTPDCYKTWRNYSRTLFCTVLNPVLSQK